MRRACTNSRHKAAIQLKFVSRGQRPGFNFPPGVDPRAFFSNDPFERGRQKKDWAVSSSDVDKMISSLEKPEPVKPVVDVDLLESIFSSHEAVVDVLPSKTSSSSSPIKDSEAAPTTSAKLPVGMVSKRDLLQQWARRSTGADLPSSHEELSALMNLTGETDVASGDTSASYSASGANDGDAAASEIRRPLIARTAVDPTQSNDPLDFLIEAEKRLVAKGFSAQAGGTLAQVQKLGGGVEPDLPEDKGLEIPMEFRGGLMPRPLEEKLWKEGVFNRMVRAANAEIVARTPGRPERRQLVERKAEQFRAKLAANNLTVHRLGAWMLWEEHEDPNEKLSFERDWEMNRLRGVEGEVLVRRRSRVEADGRAREDVDAEWLHQHDH